MNKFLRSYIDHQIIDEYADKDLSGFTLYIQDLPENEQSNLLDAIAASDPDFKSYILEYAQNLIDERLPIREQKLRYDEGFKPHQDEATGEVSWVLRRTGSY